MPQTRPCEDGMSVSICICPFFAEEAFFETATFGDALLRA